MNARLPRRKFFAVLGLAAVLVGRTGLRGAEKSAFTSTSLASANYDAKALMLELEFRSGARYRYRQVPAEIYAGLLRAESKGRYFTQQIRGKFAFEKVRAKR